MQHSTQTLTAPDGVALFAQAWQPETPPRGVILLAHGVGEHSDRYQHVAAHLVARGYAVYTLDHRGHGRSGGERVAIRRLDEYASDLRLVFDQMKTVHPDAPRFVYGHSMGSIVALLFALRHQSELDGIIITGTALRLPISLPSALYRPAAWLARIVGSATLIPAIDLAGLSRDPEVIAAYQADPMIHSGRMRLDWSIAMATAAQEVERRLPELRLPLLALHGSNDTITMPAGADVVRQRAGSDDLTVRVYPGLRHEIHNEPEQAQVLDDIAAWLDAHTESETGSAEA